MLVNPSFANLTNKVKSYLIQGRYEEALEDIVQAEISKTIPVSEENFFSLYKIEGFIGTLHFKEALELSKVITNQKLNLRNYSIIIQANLFEIECYRNLQLFEEALKINDKVERIFKNLSQTIKTESSELYARYNYYKAHLLQSMGKLHESIESYQKALNIVLVISERLFQQRILVNLASAYWQLGNLEQAHKLSMQALAIKTTEESYQTISKCLNLLGLIAQDKGNISSALNFYNQSLSLKYKLGNRVEIAKTLHSIGYVNQLLDKFTESLMALQECYNIFEELENYSEMSKLQNDIGLIYLKQGDVIQSLKNFKTALGYSLRVKNDYLTARNYLSLSKIFLLKQDLKSSLMYAEKSLALHTNVTNDIEAGENFLQIGILLFLEKDFVRAKKNFLDSEDIFKNIKNKSMIVRAQLIRILLFEKLTTDEDIHNTVLSIKEVAEKSDDNQLKLLNDLVDAFSLKNSIRIQDKANALQLFRNCSQYLKLDSFFNEYALLQELVLLFYEYSLLRNDKTFEDIKICTTKLLNLSDLNNQFTLKIYLFRLKAKLALLFEGIDEAIAYMEEAFLFAQAKNQNEIIPKLQEEYESLDKKISYWNNFKKKKHISQKEIEQIKIQELITEIFEKNLIFYL